MCELTRAMAEERHGCGMGQHAMCESAFSVYIYNKTQVFWDVTLCLWVSGS